MKIVYIVLALFMLVNVSYAWNFINPIVPEVVRIPGVKTGDWAKYSFAFNYSSNDPTNPISPPGGYGDVEYVKVEVLSVSGTNITFKAILHFENGTESATVVWEDVSSGIMGGLLFIGANLTAGDALFPIVGSPVINATLTRTYAGAEREVNYVGMLQNNTGPYGLVGLMKADVYWDRTSGIVAEMTEEINYTRQPEGYATHLYEHLAMTETNIWSPTLSVSVEVRFVPRTLNLKSRGRWVTVLVQFPEGYDASMVDVSSVMLNGTIQAEQFRHKTWCDCEHECGRVLILKFDRSDVIDYILKNVDFHGRSLKVTLTLTGKLKTGAQFCGSDRITVLRVHHRPE